MSPYMVKKPSFGSYLSEREAVSAKIAPYQELMQRKFTWASLDAAICAGETLIVGAGRFVYGICKFPLHFANFTYLFRYFFVDSFPPWRKCHFIWRFRNWYVIHFIVNQTTEF